LDVAPHQRTWPIHVGRSLDAECVHSPGLAAVIDIDREGFRGRTGYRITAAIPVNVAWWLPGVVGHEVPGLLIFRPSTDWALIRTSALPIMSTARAAHRI